MVEPLMSLSAALPPCPALTSGRYGALAGLRARTTQVKIAWKLPATATGIHKSSATTSGRRSLFQNVPRAAASGPPCVLPKVNTLG